MQVHERLGGLQLLPEDQFLGSFTGLEGLQGFKGMKLGFRVSGVRGLGEGFRV